MILLWTKTEFLDLPKIKQLMKDGVSKAEAMEQAPKKAWVDFENSIHQDFTEFKYPPKAFVAFQSQCFIYSYVPFLYILFTFFGAGMHEAGGKCNELIKKTTDALSSKELQQLFLSKQKNNLEICGEYAIKR